VTVLLYLGDDTVSEDEWECRRCLIDLHDFRSREEFLSLIGAPAPRENPADTRKMLQDRLENNPFFKTLHSKRRKRLLSADDMFIEGRQAAINKIGWTEDHARGVYKYLSMHSHTMPMSFHRTEAHSVYAQGSDSPKIVAGFATEHARHALGAACVRMLMLFPHTENALKPAVLTRLRAEYRAEPIDEAKGG
jgi:hypothetical protein